MRLFWSVVLTGGLLLVGFDVYGSRRERVQLRTGTGGQVATMEDGTGFPPPPK